ncbi:MAG: hypothetical protein EA423_05950, partial [Phycisphaerales bacterium]
MHGGWAIRRMAVLGRLGRRDLGRTLSRARLASIGASLWLRLVVFVSCWAVVTISFVAISIGLVPVVLFAVPEVWWDLPGFRGVVVASIAAAYLFVAVWMPLWTAMQIGHAAMLRRISRWIREGS